MHIVLIEPEIHWNTGNIGRTCIATGSTLHLVGKLGFSIEDKEVKRAGLDYWPKIRLSVHQSFEQFLSGIAPDAPLLFFSTKAKKLFWDAPYRPDSYLIFGSETKGLPKELYERYANRMYRIPITDDVRSLNLSTAAGVVLYEALRQTRSVQCPKIPR
ncbi:MAG: tRNA (cytidine(34)-2'-O)-methyltransferase [Elusimicrobia bacterium]|nr:tRNA (cytidine(34)-2'-O)-methyltransferase [Elusimicrobiota bacterium]